VTRSAGRPASPNGASSFHLRWLMPRGPWTRAEAVLEIAEPPAVPDLHFWALQVSFDDRGRHGGAAHLGLQWYPRHPGGTATNWGDYGPDGCELEGSRSTLPSATGNPNTRDYVWVAGGAYRLIIARADLTPRPDTTAWQGSIVDVRTGRATIVRDLWARGRSLANPMVWSEVFAPCDAPRSAVRWSELRLADDDGRSVEVGKVRASYQEAVRGGCANTDSSARRRALVQRTNTSRTTPHGAVLRLGR
jgi:hypothetical protein